VTSYKPDDQKIRVCVTVIWEITLFLSPTIQAFGLTDHPLVTSDLSIRDTVARIWK
jgi:hypothetical protein